MLMSMNGGLIVGNFGKKGYESVDVILNALIGDPSNGPVQLYDTDGNSAPDVRTTVDGDGDFCLSFKWSPTDIGKLRNTDVRLRMAFWGRQGTSVSLIREGAIVRACICVCIGQIQFNPIEEFAGKWAAIANDFLQALVKVIYKAELPAMLYNMIRFSTEMYWLNAYFEE